MANITINDLPASHELDRKAMTRIRGAGGAGWVFGWITPFIESSPQGRFPVEINFYQINNFADQMINQFQNVSVINSAPNANLNVKVDEGSTNNKL
jgi:hypothetical protein